MQGVVHLVKSEQKTWGFCSISKMMYFLWQVQYKRYVHQSCWRSGRWFSERGCILKHQIFRFVEMMLRHRYSTLYDLASLFGGRRSKLDKWTGKISKDIGTRPSALHAIFHFRRISRRIASFLMLLILKNEEVSQNYFVFDVVKLKYWVSLADLLRFQVCR